MAKSIKLKKSRVGNKTKHTACHIRHSITDREEDKRLENQNEDGKTEINSGYTRGGFNVPTIKR